MKNEHKHIILKTLDHPMRVIFWGLDDFLLMSIPVFLGMCLGSLVVMCAGFLLKPFYSKIKKRFPHQSFKHALYWNLPTMSFKKRGLFKNLPSSHVREFIL